MAQVRDYEKVVAVGMDSLKNRSQKYHRGQTDRPGWLKAKPWKQQLGVADWKELP